MIKMAPRAVAVVAGRRVDADGADPPHFPLHHVPQVQRAMWTLFRNSGTELVVCSAACGADLLALDTAASLGIRARIVLPFGVDAFRASSVTDRPGDWGPVYDRLVAAARAAGDLVLLDGREADDDAYAAANKAIIDEAAAAAGEAPIVAIAVWEGHRRVGTDATGDFLDLARARAFRLEEVRTD